MSNEQIDLPAAVPYTYTDAVYVDEHMEGPGGVSLGVNVAGTWVAYRMSYDDARALCDALNAKLDGPLGGTMGGIGI